MRVGKDNYTIYIESVLHKKKRLSEHVFFLNDKIFGGKLTFLNKSHNISHILGFNPFPAPIIAIK